MKLIVAGSRTFNNYDLLKEEITKLIPFNDDLEIVSGTARGADRLGEKLAEEFNIKLIKFPANWDLHGRSAGYKRNQEMADYADSCIVFWDGQSRGTKHMIDLAKRYNLNLKVIKY